VTELASAQVTNFSPGASLDSFGADTFDGTSGDVSGTLPGTLTFDNAQPLNDYTQGLTFPSTITFNLDLYGPAIDTPNASLCTSGGGSFYLDFFDTSNNLLTNTTEGFVLEVDINPDGSTTATTFPNSTGGPSVVTVSGPLTATPEPSSIFLVAGGLAMMGVIRYRRKARG